MLYVVVEEVWSAWTSSAEATLLRSYPPQNGGDKDAAEKIAEELASKFEKHGYEGDARHAYWWGRNESAGSARETIPRKPLLSRHPAR